MSHSLIPMYHHDHRRKVLVYLAADPTTLPQLPTEVWERVLDQLDVSPYHDRLWNFSTCCLTCRAWLPRSRYHLFKTVRVRSKEHAKQVSKMLYSIPALRTRVEELTVRGSDDTKKDASWIGLVGFHLGPKLKALQKITIQCVNFSLAKLEFYQFWGASNRSWQPGVERKLVFHNCRATHVNQLVQLAFVTKAGEFRVEGLTLDRRAGPALPVPVLPRGISFPLHRLSIHPYSPELISTGSWHTLARRCPSLSSVDISCLSISSLQLPDNRLFLVSIFDMFRCMQWHNDTNHITLSGFTSIPKVEMRTTSDDTNTLTARPHLRRELAMDAGYTEDPMEQFAQVLTYFEDAMMPGATNVNRGFHCIKLSGQFMSLPTPKSCRLLDTVLSRLRVTTPDVHMTIKGQHQIRNKCVLPQMRERFPTFCQLLPNAFCDPDGGQPCISHPNQAGGSEEAEVEGGMVEEVSEPEEDIHANTATGKRKATEGLEVEKEQARGKRRRVE